MIEIGNIQLPIHVSADIRQALEPITGAFRQRMESGTLRQQVHWNSRKWRVRLTGRGTLSTGITEIDYTQPVVVKLTTALELLSTANVFILPTTRRSDAGYQPSGWARLSANTWQQTATNLVGDTLTLTPVSGALQYRALYYPELSVYTDGPQEERHHNTGSVSWSFIGEQI